MGARADIVVREEPRRRLGGYREYSPPPELRGVVDCAWVYARPAGSDRSIPGPRHRVLPEPGLSLCFVCRRAPDGAVQTASLVLHGPIRSVRLGPPPGLHLEAVRLNPEWSRALLGVDPSDHPDSQDLLEAISPRRSRRLLDRLVRTTAPHETLATLLRTVGELRRDARVSRSTRLAHAGLERLRSPRAATLTLPSLARELHVSERHLRRLIRAETGASPKYLHRVHRLDRVVAAADAASRPDWSRLAVAGGYYDQSHLIGDFRSLTDRTPTVLHAERRAQERAPTS